MSLSIDSTPIEATRLGRNRLLAAAGGVLVGAAARLWFPEEAAATHVMWGSPCYGSGKCHACSGCKCTLTNCVKVYTCSGAHCWTGCGGCTAYKCCDWKPCGSCGVCICRCAVYGCC